MPRRIDRYRMEDGRTPLSARYFNPVWTDIDLRIGTLEELNLSWEEAVRKVSDLGLLRINEVLAPSIQYVDESAQAIEDKRLQAIATLDALQAAVDNVQADALAAVEAWKAARLAELDAWRAQLTAELPSMLQRLGDLEGEAVPGMLDRLDTLETFGTSKTIPFAHRADLRTTAPEAADMVMVPDLGVFTFSSTSTEPDDGETCFATPQGRWLLSCPAWDVAWQWIAPDIESLQERWPGRMLTGTASNPILSVTYSASASFTVTVAGASIGDHVVLTPLTGMPPKLEFDGRVSAAGTVTITLKNTAENYNGTIYPPVDGWRIAVLKET